MSRYPHYLRLPIIRRYEPLMKRLGVSKVARSPRGFLAAYKKAQGRPERLSDTWDEKREAFIKRHMAQVKKRKEPLWETARGKKQPTRRHLALIAWAYSPEASSL